MGAPTSGPAARLKTGPRSGLKGIPRGSPKRLAGMLRDPRVLSILAVVALWWIGSLFNSPEVLPSPWVIASVAWNNLTSTDVGFGLVDRSAYFHFGITLARIIGTLTVALLLGTALGLLLGLQRTAERSLGALMPFWLTLPTLLMAMLSIVWFGFSEVGGLFAVVAVVTPFVAMNVWGGTKAMDKDLLDMAEAFHASRWLSLRKVFVPQLMPYLFASFRAAFGMTWKVVALLETLGLKYGVGYMFTFWFNQFRLDQVLAWVILFVITMLVLEHGVIARVENKAFAWRPAH